MTSSDCGILYIEFFRFYQVSRMFNVNPWNLGCGAEDEENSVLFACCISFIVLCNSHFIILSTTINTHNTAYCNIVILYFTKREKMNFIKLNIFNFLIKYASLLGLRFNNDIL